MTTLTSVYIYNKYAVHVQYRYLGSQGAKVWHNGTVLWKVQSQITSASTLQCCHLWREKNTKDGMVDAVWVSLNLLGDCLNYFSTTVTKYQDHGSLLKEVFNWAPSFKGLQSMIVEQRHGRRSSWELTSCFKNRRQRETERAVWMAESFWKSQIPRAVTHFLQEGHTFPNSSTIWGTSI